MSDVKPLQYTDSTQPFRAGTVHQVPPPPPPPQPQPAAASPLPPAPHYPTDDNDDDPAGARPLKITLSAPTRLLASVLVFVSSVLQVASRPDEPLGVALCVASWLAFFWNALAALSRALEGLFGARERRLPQVSVVVVVGGGGGREVVLFGGGGGGDGDGGERDGERRRLSGASAVDLGVAGLLLVLFVLVLTVPYRVHHLWRVSRYCDGIVGLTLAVVCLEFLLVLLALFPRRSSIHFLVRPPVRGDRIQLP